MAELPNGTVTFLLTDIEDSMRLAEQLGEDSYHRLLSEHDRLVREAVVDQLGVEIPTDGDAFFVVFTDAAAAVTTALRAQLAIGNVAGSADVALRVRMGLHTGPGRRRGERYIGLTVHQVTQVCAAAHGGQIVVSALTREAAGTGPDGATWQSLGSHRLTDLSDPVELFALCHPGLPTGLPPIRLRERNSHNLPTQASSFLGRHDELVLGAQLLATTRLLNVTGPGGTGKTRLAYQLAAEQLTRFPDGVWVAELAAVSDPAQVPATLLAGLGLRDEPGRSATETIGTHLRSRRALVVLDNCEHLIEAVAAFVADVLARCEVLRVLATSREPLRLAGETIWALCPLALPDPAETDLAVLTAADAVALFCARAAETKVGFTINAENARTITAICGRVEGIPLAIELAAARVASLPLAVLAERLDHSLDLLSKGTRGAADRQGSLRGTISWSYDLLSRPEQIVFRRLSVFAGGFTVAAAEGVCPGADLAAEEVLDALEGLVDKSLVVLDQEPANEPRYRLLEVVRQFATEQSLQAWENGETQSAHAQYFLALAEAGAAHFGGEQQGRWLDRIHAEADNLRATGRWLIEHADADGAVRLCLALRFLWYVRGSVPEGRRLFSAALALSDEPTPARAAALAESSALARQQGDFAVAASLAGSAAAMARNLAAHDVLAKALLQLGFVLHLSEDYPGALAVLTESLTLSHQLADELTKTQALHHLGLVTYYGGGDAARALDVQTWCVGAFRAVGNPRHVATALVGMIELARVRGDRTGARTTGAEALALITELDDRPLLTYALHNLAAVAADERQFERAVRLLSAAERIDRQMGAMPWPAVLRGRERWLPIARRELGNRRFDALLRHGAELSPAQVAAYAASTDDGQESPLTARESEIADLVAAGLTNRQIAARLVVSERTIDGHLSRMLAKLGFRSRAQVAGWVESG